MVGIGERFLVPKGVRIPIALEFFHSSGESLPSILGGWEVKGMVKRGWARENRGRSSRYIRWQDFLIKITLLKEFNISGI
jgi:hypothetical protein